MDRRNLILVFFLGTLFELSQCAPTTDELEKVLGKLSEKRLLKLLEEIEDLPESYGSSGKKAKKDVETTRESRFLNPAQVAALQPKDNDCGAELELDCLSLPLNREYSLVGGTCNNLAHAFWGTLHRAQLRLLDPKYDTKETPRGATNLPSARNVSQTLLSSAAGTTTPSSVATLMMMQMGQFLDHDLSHTPVTEVTIDTENPSSEDNCNPTQCTNVEGSPCFPIPTSNGCTSFVRSKKFVGDNCKVPCFEKKSGFNAVHSLVTDKNIKDGNIIDLGNTGDDTAECEKRCAQNDTCAVYAHHGADFPKSFWQGKCYGRTDFNDRMVKEDKMYSGIKIQCRRCFKKKPGFNGVSGLVTDKNEKDGNIIYFGNTGDDTAACQELCAQNKECAVYAHHGADFGQSRWRGKCYGRTDFDKRMPSENKIYSGIKIQCPRQQGNEVTGWLDLSQVYGSDEIELSSLREDGNPARGKMATSTNILSGLKDMLPYVTGDETNCRPTNPTIKCFKAGDFRVNEQVGLIAMHTLFVRMHNVIEDKLEQTGQFKVEDFKSEEARGEKLFQESRRVMISLWHHMIYAEYLPVLLGDVIIDEFGIKPENGKNFFEGYDPSVRGDIYNVFSTAALRMGHSEVAQFITFLNKKYEQATKQEIKFNDIVFNPTSLYECPLGTQVSGIDSVAMGLIDVAAGDIDGQFDQQLTEHLFTEIPPTGHGLDLPARNIQRGRDHGLKGYSHWRKVCRLSEDYQGLKGNGVLSKEDLITKFDEFYPGGASEADLYAAAMNEAPVNGSLIGPTFACLIALQFRNLKLGDRFYYENDKKTTFEFDPFSCKDTKLGKEYRGEVRTTKSGKTCQKWTSQEPHTHSRTPNNHPDSDLEDNVCRNPDNEPNGPWCYTTDSNSRWEYCGVPNCKDPSECKDSKLGKDYRGEIAYTTNGTKCQDWNSQSPHKHSRTDANYPDSGLDENLCRNPDDEPNGPWCYTTDSNSRWEYCDVKKCKVKDAIAEMRKFSLARLLCETLDDVDEIQPHVMLKPEKNAEDISSVFDGRGDNSRVPCSQIPDIDYSKLI